MELSHDVALGLQGVHRGRTQIDSVASREDGRQQSPVGRLDAHHVVEARVVGVRPFGQAEVGSLAGVPRNDVADDDSAMGTRGRDQILVLRLGAERRIDLEADAVEIAVDGGRIGEIAYAARTLHRAGVYALDSDRLESAPQALIGKRGEDRGAGRRCDGRGGIGGEPHRRPRHGRPRLRFTVRVLPLEGGARVTLRQHLRLMQHRALFEPASIGRGLGRGRQPGRAVGRLRQASPERRGSRI